MSSQGGAPEGWYPDPRDPNVELWWDGAAYTQSRAVQVIAASTVAASAAGAPVATAPAASAGTSGVTSGWYDDGQHPGKLRWFDGVVWTEHLADTTPATRGAPALVGPAKPNGLPKLALWGIVGGAVVAVTVVVVTAASLVSAGSSVPHADAATGPSLEAVDSGVSTSSCPADLVGAVESGYGPSQVWDTSVIEDALGALFPSAASCVLTVDGDTADSTAFYLYWSNPGSTLAYGLADALNAAGFGDGAGSFAYSNGSATAYIEDLPAGDPNWSEYFGGGSLVVLRGQFDGAPGKVASPSGTAPLTWEDACLFSSEEVNNLFGFLGAFEMAATSNSSNPSGIECVYEQNPDSTVNVHIQVFPYDASGTFGFATNGTAWAAPDQTQAAANACEEATAYEYLDGKLQAECSAGDTPTVLSATRLAGLVFLPTHFVVVSLTGVPGNDDLTVGMREAIALISTKSIGS
jgi:hypothetical protein